MQYRPDLVIVMSPIYLLEITAQLESMNVRPKRLLAVEAPDQLEAA